MQIEELPEDEPSRQLKMDIRRLKAQLQYTEVDTCNSAPVDPQRAHFVFGRSKLFKTLVLMEWYDGSSYLYEHNGGADIIRTLLDHFDLDFDQTFDQKTKRLIELKHKAYLQNYYNTNKHLVLTNNEAEQHLDEGKIGSVVNPQDLEIFVANNRSSIEMLPLKVNFNEPQVSYSEWL